MKHLQITLLMATIFAFGAASAESLTPEDVFAAIDGESEVDTRNTAIDAERVNFDISADDMSTEDFWKPVNAGLLDDTYY